MKAILIRHGKVDYQWKKWSTSEQFDLDCRKYDEAPILPVSIEIPEIGNQGIVCRKIYVSSLARSRKTAEGRFGDRDFTETGLIDEVPLRSSVEGNVRLPLWFWNISGRLQWLSGCRRQSEPRAETRKRAEKFVKMLLDDGGDCAVVTHGFFMHTLIGCMKENGFRIGHTRMKYGNGEYVIAER